jgi:transposase-like protein
MSLKEFTAQFHDETSCRNYLFQLRWSEGFKCPHCGGKEYYYIGSRHKHQCKACRHQTSLTAGTIMHKSHLPLLTWFWAICLVSHDKRGFSALQLSTELNLPYNTAWYLLHRIRHAMAERNGKYMLSGIVEIDDTYIGSQKKGGKRGRGTTKTKVIIAISKDEDNKPQYLKMRVVPNLKGKTIEKFTTQNIQAGSTVQSDAYYSYRKPLAQNFQHTYKVFDPDSDMLKWLHIMISNSKAFINGTYHGLDAKHLQSYLDEFCYRFNRRWFPAPIFRNLLNAATLGSPLRFADLT